MINFHVETKWYSFPWFRKDRTLRSLHAFDTIKQGEARRFRGAVLISILWILVNDKFRFEIKQKSITALLAKIEFPLYRVVIDFRTGYRVADYTNIYGYSSKSNFIFFPSNGLEIFRSVIWKIVQNIMRVHFSIPILLFPVANFVSNFPP